MRNALDRRTDLQQSRKNLEAATSTCGSSSNQTLPDVTASFDYGLTGLGGTQFLRGAGFPRTDHRPDPARLRHRCSATCSATTFPSWTASLNISYPLGQTAGGRTSRARGCSTRQQQTQLRKAELQVVTAGARGGTPGADEPAARRDDARRRGSSPSGGSRPSSASSPPARPRASSCSRRSATWRRRATTSCGRSSTTTARSSTSKPCRRRRSGKASTRSTAQVDSAQCRRCRSRSSRSTKRSTSPRRSTASPWADEILVVDSGSTDGTPDIARGKGATVVVPRVVRATSIRRTTPPAWRPTTGSSRSTPTSASRRRWPAKSASCSRGEPPMRGYRVPRVTFHLGRVDPHHGLLSRLPDAPVRPPRGALAGQVRARIGVGGRPGRPLPPRARALLLPRPARPARSHQPLHDARGAADARSRTPRRTCSICSSIPRRRSSATTCCGAGSSTARAGLTISLVNAYSVFLKFAKLWELQRTPKSQLPTPNE